MIEWVVSSCILILAVIALRYLLRGRISLRLQYALWLLVLARLLLPVSFGSTDISVMSVVERAPAVQAAESVRDVDVIWQAGNGTVQGHPIGGAVSNTVVLAEPSAADAQFGHMENALTLRKILLPVWRCGDAAGVSGGQRPLCTAFAALPPSAGGGGCGTSRLCGGGAGGALSVRPVPARHLCDAGHGGRSGAAAPRGGPRDHPFPPWRPCVGAAAGSVSGAALVEPSGVVGG